MFSYSQLCFNECRGSFYHFCMTVFMYILYDLSILSSECFIGMYSIVPDDWTMQQLPTCKGESHYRYQKSKYYLSSCMGHRQHIYYGLVARCFLVNLYNYAKFFLECSDKTIHMHKFGQFHLRLVSCRRLHGAFMCHINRLPPKNPEWTIERVNNTSLEKRSIGMFGKNKTLCTHSEK